MAAYSPVAPAVLPGSPVDVVEERLRVNPRPPTGGRGTGQACLQGVVEGVEVGVLHRSSPRGSLAVDKLGVEQSGSARPPTLPGAGQHPSRSRLSNGSCREQVPPESEADRPGDSPTGRECLTVIALALVVAIAVAASA